MTLEPDDGIQTIKMGLNHFEGLRTFGTEG